jgi:site-specific recombinase XerD
MDKTTNRTFTSQIVNLTEMREDTSLAAVLQSYFLSRRKISDATRTWYANYLNGFITYATSVLGREPLLSDFDPFLVNAYLAMIGSTPTKKYPNGSVVSERSAAVTLKTFGSWLAKQGIKANRHGGSVLADVEQAKVADDVRQPLSQSEKDRLFSAAGLPGDMTHALVEFMLATGLRLNEARALMVSDLDLQNCTVTVRSETSKFRKGRTVYFHPDVAAHMDRYLRSREDNWNANTRKAFLWVNGSGEPFTIDAFGKVFLRLKARSGIENFSAHICRHTWATSFMQVLHASLLELKRQGGWAKWEMLERYSHVAPPRDRNALPNPLARLSAENRTQSNSRFARRSTKPPIALRVVK